MFWHASSLKKNQTPSTDEVICSASKRLPGKPQIITTTGAHVLCFIALHQKLAGAAEEANFVQKSFASA